MRHSRKDRDVGPPRPVVRGSARGAGRHAKTAMNAGTAVGGRRLVHSLSLGPSALSHFPGQFVRFIIPAHAVHRLDRLAARARERRAARLLALPFGDGRRAAVPVPQA